LQLPGELKHSSLGGELQAIRVPSQSPFGRHWSFIVQASPSLQLVPESFREYMHCPPLLHVPGELKHWLFGGDVHITSVPVHCP
jgi:hypothetical protein